MEKSKTLVLGIGNLLLGDEGIGIHAVEHIQKNVSIENVDFLDGGTGGFVLLSLFHDYGTIIIIDATLDSNPVGTIRLLEPKYSTDYPKSLSAHDIGLKDLVESAILLNESPKIFLIIVTIKDFQDLKIGLSPDVQKAIPEVEKLVIALLSKN